MHETRNIEGYKGIHFYLKKGHSFVSILFSNIFLERGRPRLKLFMNRLTQGLSWDRKDECIYLLLNELIANK